MDTKFYFIRHGDAYPDTPDNIQFPETPLNKRGVKQAKRLRGRLKKIKRPEVVILSSSHQRAVDTMKIATKGFKAYPIIMSDLIEIGSDFWPNADTLTLRTLEEPDTYKSCSKVVLATFEDLWSKHKGKTVIIFTHGNWTRCLISTLMGAGWKGFGSLVIGLSSITIIEEDDEGKPLIATVSEMAHLL